MCTQCHQHFDLPLFSHTVHKMEAYGVAKKQEASTNCQHSFFFVQHNETYSIYSLHKCPLVKREVDIVSKALMQLHERTVTLLFMHCMTLVGIHKSTYNS